MLQCIESLETSFLSFCEYIVIPITNHLDATMYFNLGSIIGSGIFQTDYSEKLRRKMKNKSAFNGVWTHNPWFVSPTLYNWAKGEIYKTLERFTNIFAIMSPIFVRPERVWPKLSSIQGIRANLVYIVSLVHIIWWD